MRKKALSVCIAMSFSPAVTRLGPVSPYRSYLNTQAYYRMLGQEIWVPQSVGKSRAFEKNLLYPFRYAGSTVC